MRQRAAAATTGLAWNAIPSPAAASIGRSLAPSPTASVASDGMPHSAARASERCRAWSRGSRSACRTVPAIRPCDEIEPVGDDPVEAEFRADPFGEDGEPARDQRGRSTPRPHRRDQRPRARRQPDACGRFVEHPTPAAP